MWSATTVLVCSLALLGRSAETFPPIELVHDLPADVSPLAEGFVRPGSGTISIVTSTRAFREAQASRLPCPNSLAYRKLASILVHEEWHVRHGSDERGAYEAQLMTLAILGSGPGTPLYGSVRRSMATVLQDAHVRAGR